MHEGIEHKGATTVPGFSDTTSAPARLPWWDPLLEPKQQHRFICQFPVYMPMGTVSDSKTLTERSAGFAAKCIAKYPGGCAAGMAAAETGAKFYLQTFGHPACGSSELGNEKDREEAKTWWRANKTAQGFAHKGLAARMSSYIVTSFTPPSYGATIGTAPVAAMPADEVADPTKTKLKMDQAQITLVSTLQDDLHFSLNFLYNLYAPSGDENVLVNPFLFPPALWGKASAANSYLTILDFGGRGTPDSTKQQRALLEAPPAGGGAEYAKTFPSQITGIHKFRAPYVTGISFSEYSYRGEAILEATVTLGHSIGVADFYSYETYNAGAPRGGDTRYGGYSGLGKDSKVKEFQDAIAASYGDYPNFSIQNSANPGPGKATMKAHHDTAQRKVEHRRLWIDHDMSRADRSTVTGRRGTLDRMLESKVQQEAQEAAEAAQREADAENPRPAATFPSAADRQASSDAARGRYLESQDDGTLYHPVPEPWETAVEINVPASRHTTTTTRFSMPEEGGAITNPDGSLNVSEFGKVE